MDIGITKDCVLNKFLQRWITPWIDDCRLKYVAKRDNRVTAKWNCFPFYQTTTINQWFDSSLSGEDSSVQSRTLSVINVDQNGKRAKCYTKKDGKEFPESLASDNFEVYFHGTNHESAQHIIKNGIKLDSGKRAQDFSHGYGFYLFKTFEEALNWAGSKYDNSAVLCFRVNRTDLRGDNNDKGLDLRDNRQQWKEIVFKFWQGKKITEIDHFDFIEGPEASWSKTKRSRRLSKPAQKNGTYQLCIRQNSCARLFDHSLDSVLFFE